MMESKHITDLLKINLSLSLTRTNEKDVIAQQVFSSKHTHKEQQTAKPSHWMHIFERSQDYINQKLELCHWKHHPAKESCNQRFTVVHCCQSLYKCILAHQRAVRIAFPLGNPSCSSALFMLSKGCGVIDPEYVSTKFRKTLVQMSAIFAFTSPEFSSLWSSSSRDCRNLAASWSAKSREATTRGGVE